MSFPKKPAAMAAGLIAAFSLASLAQDPSDAAQRGSAAGPRQIVVGGSIDWVERSDVAALKEGVLESIEFSQGRTVTKGEVLGKLHAEMAELTVAKAKLAAENMGEITKAEAQLELARTTLARNIMLDRRSPGSVSEEDKAKAVAEVKVAEALTLLAGEQKKLAKADLDLAERSLQEHFIIAPFDGVITDKMKHDGESVRSNEPVVRIGRIDKMRFVGWIPLETVVRLKGNEVIDVRPVIDGAKLAIEDRMFRGNLKSISREMNTVRSNDVMVVGEIDNPPSDGRPELELRQGMKAEMTIYLDGAPAKVAVAPRPAK